MRSVLPAMAFLLLVACGAPCTEKHLSVTERISVVNGQVVDDDTDVVAARAAGWTCAVSDSHQTGTTTIINYACTKCQ